MTQLNEWMASEEEDQCFYMACFDQRADLNPIKNMWNYLCKENFQINMCYVVMSIVLQAKGVLIKY